jgi:hypothetical protein
MTFSTISLIVTQSLRVGGIMIYCVCTNYHIPSISSIKITKKLPPALFLPPSGEEYGKGAILISFDQKKGCEGNFSLTPFHALITDQHIQPEIWEV